MLITRVIYTYFTPCSSVSIVNFEHVNADWGLDAKLKVEDFEILSMYP